MIDNIVGFRWFCDVWRYVSEELESFEVKRARAETCVALLETQYPDARPGLNFENAYELLVATVLSAQTTDAKVNTVTPALFQRWPDSHALADASIPELEEAVRPLGLFRRRARSLQALARHLVSEHEGEVPGTREELVELSGVGRKTANVVLGNWFGAQEISVDTHVARVTRRLGWVDSKSPLAIERELWELLPDAHWTVLSHQLIQLGRQVCHARKPLCEQCVLAALCPSFGNYA